MSSREGSESRPYAAIKLGVDEYSMRRNTTSEAAGVPARERRSLSSSVAAPSPLNGGYARIA